MVIQQTQYSLDSLLIATYTQNVPYDINLKISKYKNITSKYKTRTAHKILSHFTKKHVDFFSLQYCYFGNTKIKG